MRMKQAVLMGVTSLAPALTGCLVHVRSVPKTLPAPVVMTTTVNDLLQQVNQRYAAIQTINSSVEIAAATGGGRQGKVTEYPSFSGYIFLRKPEDLRVLMRVPVLGSQALDMVSDGKSWKLWVPPKHLAYEGTGDETDPSQKGLESLRPSVIFDSLLIRGLGENQIVALNQDTRIIPSEKNKKDLVEDQDYDLSIFAQPQGQTAHTLRVIHISRSDLLPYQQDIYDANGVVVTRASYSNYQLYNNVPFPMRIKIERPLDQYTLTITVTKLTLNQKLEDDQFELKIPDNVPVKAMK